MNWKHYLLLGLLGIFGGALGGLLSARLFHEKQLKSKAIYVVDGSGNIRAVLGVLRDGQPGLTFFDKEGKPRTLVGIFSNGRAGMSVFDRFGRVRVLLGESVAGVPALSLFDGQGKVRAKLDLSEYGWPKLKLMDPKGQSVFQVPLPVTAPSETPRPGSS